MLGKIQNVLPYGATTTMNTPLVLPGEKNSVISEDLQGSTISFHNIHYTVDVKDPKKICGKLPKEILLNANGMFKPGMNAIMGATGGGKTTLLDVLAGRKEKSRVIGHVLVDGNIQPENFNVMTGYVEQEDVLLGTLTVRESFEFSANLRLPKTVSKEEKERRVKETIFELGLENCADTKIGNAYIKGISGGEKKRTSIGMELIISPPVLFLDEPTTGLDSNTANSIMRLLYHLSRGGRTIVFAIHQPRYAIFRLFDRLTMLGQGKTIYHGPAGEASMFFQSMGYECEPNNNPADFFMDVMQGDYGEYSGEGLVLTRYYSDEIKPMTEEDSVKSDPYTKKVGLEALEMQSRSRETLYNRLAERYKFSKWYMEEKEELDKALVRYQSNKLDKPEEPIQLTSSFTQFCALNKRGFINMMRSPQAIYMQVAILAMMGLIIGIIYFQLDHRYPSGIQNRTGAFFFIVMNAIFVNMWAVDIFFQERRVMVHELLGGFYTVTPAFLSKLVSDIIPMRLLPTAACSLITYFMIGFRTDVAHFFVYFLAIFLASLTIISMAYWISASVKIQTVANLAMSLGCVLQMVFGGFFINIRDVADWLSWLQYFSVFRYSLNVLYINEFKDMGFCEFEDGNKHCISNAGNAYLEEQNISHKTPWDLWQNVLAMLLLSVFYLMCSYVQLRRMKLTS